MLSGDRGWLVRDVDVEEVCQDRSLWDAILEVSFIVTNVKGEAAIANQLHDHADHVPVR